MAFGKYTHLLVVFKYIYLVALFYAILSAKLDVISLFLPLNGTR